MQANKRLNEKCAEIEKKLQVAHVVLMFKMIKDKAGEKACALTGGRKTEEERFLRGKKKGKKNTTAE